jgi:hypothetical protein
MTCKNYKNALAHRQIVSYHKPFTKELLFTLVFLFADI